MIGGKRCTSGGLHHRFEARYTEEGMPGLSNIQVEQCTASELRTLLVRQVYVGDLCIWCGTTRRAGKESDGS